MSQRTPSQCCAIDGEHADHRLARRGVEVIELRDVAPRREVGIAAAGDEADRLAVRRFDRVEQRRGPRGSCRACPGRRNRDACGSTRDRTRCGSGTKSRTSAMPRFASSARAASSPLPSAHALVGLVGLDAVGGAGHVRHAPAGQDAVVLREQRGIRARHEPADGAALPHAHQVDDVHPGCGHGVPLRGRHVAERDETPLAARQPLEPRPRADFIQVGMRSHVSHGFPRTARINGKPRIARMPRIRKPDKNIRVFRVIRGLLVQRHPSTP